MYKKVFFYLDHVEKKRFLHGIQHVSINTFDMFLDVAKFLNFLQLCRCCIKRTVLLKEMYVTYCTYCTYCNVHTVRNVLYVTYCTSEEMMILIAS